MAAAEKAVSVTVAANGTATATITTGTQFQTWIVSQISVEMASAPIGATCALRKGGFLISPLIPTGDAASGEPPITLRPGEQLTVTFTGCTPNAVGNVFVIYDDGNAS